MSAHHAREPRTGRPAAGLADRAKGLVHSVDRAQQTRPWLAIAVATWKKFSDNQAGNLAALIAYYAFASLFPLLLVAYTHSRPHRQEQRRSWPSG